MLYLNMQVGDVLELEGGRITIHLERKSGSELKLGVDADRSIDVRMVPAGQNPKPAWAKGLAPRG